MSLIRSSVGHSMYMCMHVCVFVPTITQQQEHPFVYPPHLCGCLVVVVGLASDCMYIYICQTCMYTYIQVTFGAESFRCGLVCVYMFG